MQRTKTAEELERELFGQQAINVSNWADDSEDDDGHPPPATSGRRDEEEEEDGWSKVC
jgi:hypothetical protein